MRKKKRVILVPFANYDRTAIQEYLEDQARKGWMLESIDFGWVFRRTAPRNIRFAVCYFPDASAYDPRPTSKQQQFIDLCTHTGWVLVDSNAQMHIFYHTEPDPIPIETDPVMEVRTIHQVTIKQYGALWIVMIINCLLRIFLDCPTRAMYPLQELSSMDGIAMYVLWIILLIVWVIDISQYFLWYRKAKRIAQDKGAFYPVKNSRRFQLFLISIALAAIVMAGLNTDGSDSGIVMLLCFVLVAVVVMLIQWLTNVMKKKGIPGGTNKAITVVVSIIATFALISIISSTINSGVFSFLAPEEVTYTCEHNDYTHQAHRDAIPLRAEDLTGEIYTTEGYSTYAYGDSSFILGQYMYHQTSCQNLQEMNYTVLDIKLPSLYYYCLDILFYRDRGSYMVICENRCGAEIIYQRYADGDPKATYLICLEDRIAKLDANWLLTEEQLTIVASILKDCPLSVD